MVISLFTLGHGRLLGSQGLDLDGSFGHWTFTDSYRQVFLRIDFLFFTGLISSFHRIHFVFQRIGYFSFLKIKVRCLVRQICNRKTPGQNIPGTFL